MNKGEGNFLLGYFLGRGNRGNKEQGGCLASIVGFFLLGVIVLAIIQPDFREALIPPIVFIVVVAVIIGVVIAMRKNKRKKDDEEQKQSYIATKECYDLYEEGQFTRALEKAEALAVENNDAAANVAGLCYLYGTGCDVDEKKAFQYFSQAQNTNIESRGHYAEMLVYGIGCEKNLEKGINLLKEVSKQDNFYALMRLGELEIFSDLVPKDVQGGLQKLRKAADANYSSAQYLVARMQIEGLEGVPVNKKIGWDLMEKAAQSGLQSAIEYIDNFKAEDK